MTPSNQREEPKMTHTPTRIKIDGQVISDAYIAHALGISKEAAAIVVRAVNTHEDLVKALKECSTLLSSSLNYDEGDPDTMMAVKFADDAVAKAEGRS